MYLPVSILAIFSTFSKLWRPNVLARHYECVLGCFSASIGHEDASVKKNRDFFRRQNLENKPRTRFSRHFEKVAPQSKYSIPWWPKCAVGVLFVMDYSVLLASVQVALVGDGRAGVCSGGVVDVLVVG